MAISSKKTRIQTSLFSIGIIIGFILFILSGQYFEQDKLGYLKKIGAITLLFAGYFMFVPFISLSKFGESEKGKSYMDTSKIAQKGVYAIVRHPQYLGYMLLIAGFSCIYQNIISATIGLFIIVLLFLFTMHEEKLLENNFGEEYIQYKKQVPQFNFIWGLVKYVVLKNNKKM